MQQDSVISAADNSTPDAFPESHRGAPSLRELISARAPHDGTLSVPESGVHYYKASEPCPFRHMEVFEPRLIVVAQGRKVAHFKGGDLLYEQDRSLVLTGRGEFTGHVIDASAERPYLAVCVALTPDSVARALLALADAEPQQKVNEPPPKNVPAFVVSRDGLIESTVVRLILALDDPTERKVLAPFIMDELVFRLLRSDAAAWLRSAVHEGDEAIEQAMIYMRSNITGALSVDQVARQVGMSPSHFAHRFTAVARISPMRFMKQLRLEKARELMLIERLRASEAASRVGYESPSHFTRDFKVAYGKAPAEYIRSVRVQ